MTKNNLTDEQIETAIKSGVEGFVGLLKKTFGEENVTVLDASAKAQSAPSLPDIAKDEIDMSITLFKARVEQICEAHGIPLTDELKNDLKGLLKLVSVINVGAGMAVAADRLEKTTKALNSSPLVNLVSQFVPEFSQGIDAGFAMAAQAADRHHVHYLEGVMKTVEEYDKEHGLDVFGDETEKEVTEP